VKNISYPMLSYFRNNFTFWKVLRLGPFCLSGKRNSLMKTSILLVDDIDRKNRSI
jgi:hypothetical protein